MITDPNFTQLNNNLSQDQVKVELENIRSLAIKWFEVQILHHPAMLDQTNLEHVAKRSLSILRQISEFTRKAANYG